MVKMERMICHFFDNKLNTPGGLTQIENALDFGLQLPAANERNSALLLDITVIGLR